MLEETGSTNIPTTDYIYLDDGRLIATFSPATRNLSYIHSDRLGTPQLATNSAQSVVWSTAYTPFGQTGTIAGTATQNLRLPGQYSDSETGWSQNGFRDYVPTLGRYLESDPIGLSGGLNTYGYLAGNPLKDADRLGLCNDSYWTQWGNSFNEGFNRAWSMNQLPTTTATLLYTGANIQGDYATAVAYDEFLSSGEINSLEYLPPVRLSQVNAQMALEDYYGKSIFNQPLLDVPNFISTVTSATLYAFVKPSEDWLSDSMFVRSTFNSLGAGYPSNAAIASFASTQIAAFNRTICHEGSVAHPASAFQFQQWINSFPNQ